MSRRFLCSMIGAALLVGAAALPASAQDHSYYAYKNNKARYEQTLTELLDAARSDLGITIAVDANVKPYLEQKVPMAPWKYWADPDLRLAYILAPLDLTFEKTGENSFRVFEPWYMNRPEDEAAAHLERAKARYADRESWEKRRDEIRATLLKEFQLDPAPKKTPLNPIVGETRQHDGYSTTNVALEVFPKYWVCGTLFRPTEGDGPFPLVVSPHGHGKEGRFAADQQYRAATLARMGAVVFAHGMLGWVAGETPLKVDAHRDPISGGIQAWSTMRVIDYLTSLENVDATRIGITGESGGGSQTFYASALDERITVSVPAVMVSGHFYGGCPCESGTPFHSRLGCITNAEVAALFAPKPLKLIASQQDWTKNTPTVEYPFLQSIYGLYDAADRVEYEIFDEPHGYGKSNRGALYPFFAKELGLDLSRVDESKVTIEPMEAMLPFGPNCEKYPEGAVRTLEELRAAFEAAKSAE